MCESFNQMFTTGVWQNAIILWVQGYTLYCCDFQEQWRDLKYKVHNQQSIH